MIAHSVYINKKGGSCKYTGTGDAIVDTTLSWGLIDGRNIIFIQNDRYNSYNKSQIPVSDKGHYSLRFATLYL